ncbi:hypothetical protein [Pedobacter sp. MR2016-24]|uniref:hypothetical protein n=1 Tax=Pedobacter sp. MR2016-24 TaxID=2994466 RepID=UPI002245729A|nr:hypothetical protein [Pedobacter sp. MR2016-24]MCX2483921.1 hypothetical protein [Pedobacter sp. MR2016-24]
MKKLLLIATLGIGSLIAAAPAKAQVSLSVNIGTQPQWGPTGYDHVDYYYLPEVESYYYVPTRQFVYYSGNRWVHARNLPSRYRDYDLYRGRKVVINSPRPYLHHNNYRTQYGRANYGYSRPARVVVRNNYRGNNYRRESFSRRDNRRGRDQFRAQNNRGDHGHHDRGGNKGGRGRH